MVGGSKGGVGKTILTVSLIDFLFNKKKEKSLSLIETDTSNPDTGKIFLNNDKVCLYTLDLDTKDDWIELVNISDQEEKNYIVINTAARNSNSIKKYGGILQAGLKELKRELLTLWIINRQRDSLELLKKFLEIFPEEKIHVLRNNYFGAPEKFQRYEESNIKERIEKQGAKTLDFPDLADRVSDIIYSDRLSIEEAIKKSPIGNRAELERWRKACEKMFEKII